VREGKSPDCAKPKLAAEREVVRRDGKYERFEGCELGECASWSPSIAKIRAVVVDVESMTVVRASGIHMTR